MSVVRGALSLRFLRFALTGGVVTLVNVGVMSALLLLRVPPQLALAGAYSCALLAHFTLNRQFVFGANGAFMLRLSLQGVRYLGLALSSYAVTAVALATLPAALGFPAFIVYLGTSLVLAGVSFLALRAWVFHAAGGDELAVTAVDER